MTAIFSNDCSSISIPSTCGLTSTQGIGFIAGNDPLEYFKRFRNYLSHAHIKDVSEELAAAVRGDETGIACSLIPLGGGVNAENIRKCIEYLKESDWSGVLSVECYGTDENIASSIDFLRGIIG